MFTFIVLKTLLIFITHAIELKYLFNRLYSTQIRCIQKQALLTKKNDNLYKQLRPTLNVLSSVRVVHSGYLVDKRQPPPKYSRP